MSGPPQRVSTEDVVAAYLATGSVWKAGKRVGLSGQTVHDRLRAIGHPMGSRSWQPDEDSELGALLGEGLVLAEIAARLGRTYAGVACRASELGIRSNRPRAKKLPRGAGWDKVTTLRHMKRLEAYQGKVTLYARANGLSIELFMRALQTHCPERWKAYLEAHTDVPRKVCAYCESEFIPASGKQMYCERACGDIARRDHGYFGGRRRETVGLATQTCQLCKRVGIKGLSSHHVLGKENDPDNDMLVALCQGCHKIVTLLATRTFVDDEEGWEALISLAWLRKHGQEWKSLPPGEVLHVTVDLERYTEDEDGEMAL